MSLLKIHSFLGYSDPLLDQIVFFNRGGSTHYRETLVSSDGPLLALKSQVKGLYSFATVG